MSLAAGEYWKYTTTALAGALIASASFFAVGATKWIDRSEAKALMQQESPYIVDRRYLIDGLTGNQQAIRELAVVVRMLSEKQSEMIGELRAQRGAKPDK